MEKYLLGIDIGTTGTKTMLFSPEGSCISRAYQAYPTNNPYVGWSEQDPLDWWKAVVDTVRQTCEDPDIAKGVVAISLSVQGGTTVPVDSNFEPVRPAIVWTDIRCEAERELFLREVGGDETMYRKTGWHLGSNLNALQIRWLKEHEPDNFRNTAMFLSVPDYIAYKMTGIAALDHSNIGINQLGNIAEGSYDPDILSFAGIRENQLPQIIPSGHVIGHLTPLAAETLGLSTDCVLVSGAHDQYAVAVGAGAVTDGDILIGSGTCWVVTCISDAPDFASGLSQSVAAVPGKWGSLRSLSSGGVCLDWFREKILGPENILPYEQINREAADCKAAEEELFFYPFSGITVSGKQLTKAAFLGMDMSHTKRHLIRAVMEGVVFQIVWMMESFRSKPSAEGLILAGGASRSPLWTQLLADVSGYSVRVPEAADLACVGAAVLAGVGAGVFGSVTEGYRKLTVAERVVHPDPAASEIYQSLLQVYKRKSKALEEA